MTMQTFEIWVISFGHQTVGNFANNNPENTRLSHYYVCMYSLTPSQNSICYVLRAEIFFSEMKNFMKSGEAVSFNHVKTANMENYRVC